jgi:hypothetical protein
MSDSIEFTAENKQMIEKFLKAASEGKCEKCPEPEICCSQAFSVSAVDVAMFERAGAVISGKTINPNNELCVFFEDGKCSIEDKKPLACREFFCGDAILADFEGSKIIAVALDSGSWIEREKEERKKKNTVSP